MSEIITATEAAKRIRADIKIAARNNSLGDFPPGITISVRREYASLMSAIAITIKGAPDEWALMEVNDEYGTRRVPTKAAKDLAAVLMKIVRRHFEPDGRHQFADVYLHDGPCVPASRAN